MLRTNFKKINKLWNHEISHKKPIKVGFREHKVVLIRMKCSFKRKKTKAKKIYQYPITHQQNILSLHKNYYKKNE